MYRAHPARLITPLRALGARYTDIPIRFAIMRRGEFRQAARAAQSSLQGLVRHGSRPQHGVYRSATIRHSRDHLDGPFHGLVSIPPLVFAPSVMVASQVFSRKHSRKGSCRSYTSMLISLDICLLEPVQNLRSSNAMDAFDIIPIADTFKHSLFS